jgi:uncharacterized protein
VQPRLGNKRTHPRQHWLRIHTSFFDAARMNPIFVGKAITTETSGDVNLLPKYGNRHGLVAGATGTGKTVTLMTLAEGFSRIGVPVFLADVKGDVSGLAVAGSSNEKLQQRVEQLGITDYRNEAAPVVFWDLWGKSGHPVRTTVSEMGPTLLARILELNDTQSGVLDILFKLADDRGLLLLDLEDFRALLNLIAEERKDISTSYGLVSTQSIGAIQRALLRLEQEGAQMFFGEPALELADIMRTNYDGRGVVNILAADQLILKPRLYSSFLLWLLSELFETLPEVGDLEKPKLVFVFDEAHLLFNDAPAALQQRIEQVVRLIRSKGVGVYFCSQFPDDVPANVLGQLGNRVQHALRAFTPRDQKAVKTAAETFVSNPHLNVASTIGQLGVGEALVSMLLDKGIPMPVEKTLIAPPRCRMGAITEAERMQVRANSPVGIKYDTPVNRESAAEVLAARIQAASQAAPATQQEGEAGFGQKFNEFLFGTKRRQGVVESVAKQTTRNVGGSIGRSVGSSIGESVAGKVGKKYGGQIGNQVIRGILGGIFGRR